MLFLPIVRYTTFGVLGRGGAGRHPNKSALRERVGVGVLSVSRLGVCCALSASVARGRLRVRPRAAVGRPRLASGALSTLSISCFREGFGFVSPFVFGVGFSFGCGFCFNFGFGFGSGFGIDFSINLVFGFGFGFGLGFLFGRTFCFGGVGLGLDVNFGFGFGCSVCLGLRLWFLAWLTFRNRCCYMTWHGEGR